MQTRCRPRTQPANVVCDLHEAGGNRIERARTIDRSVLRPLRLKMIIRLTKRDSSSQRDLGNRMR